MQRREFFRSLAGAPLIARPEHKNRHAHHSHERLYHGPIKLPNQVLDIATRAPAYRTTYGKPCIRLALDGITYLFRTGLCGDSYIGEIVRTDTGSIRVHVWTAIPDAPPLADILTRKNVSARPERPPTAPPTPSWGLDANESLPVRRTTADADAEA